jgi:hypothetical protein
MAENIVAGLFGLNPQMYGEQQRRSALQEGIDLAQLDPASRGAAMTYAGAKGLGGAIAGAMGIEDPQLKLISARNSIAQQIDQTNPESILKGAQMLAQAGDQQGAMALAQYARQAQSEMAQTQQRLSASRASEAQATRERMTPQQQNAMAYASTVAEPGTPQFNSVYQKTLQDLINKEKPDLTSTEQKNAKALALTAGPEGSAPYMEKYASELNRLTTKAEGRPLIKEIGVAEKTREPVYTYQVGNDDPVQVTFGLDEKGKQKMFYYSGGVDRKTSETKVGGVTLPAGESEFVKQLGKKDADRVDTAITVRDTAVSTINSLNKLAALPDNQLITGQFATGRVGATNLLVTLGLAAPSDTNRLVSSQEYQKVAGDVILQTLGGKLGSGFSNADREFIQGLIPQLETNPAARRQLISFMQNKNQEIVKESIRLENYARDKNGLKGFEPKIPMSVAPSQPRPYSGLSDAELEAKIQAAQTPQPRR